jgi:hypothetical protein
VAPSTGTLEVMFGQVESGERKNMSLIHFMSRDEQDVEPLAAKLDKSGILKVTRRYGESQAPRTPEELRQKVKLLGHTYIFVQLKYPNRDSLREINPNLFNKYVDYLLGEHVFGLKAKDANSMVRRCHHRRWSSYIEL